MEGENPAELRSKFYQLMIGGVNLLLAAIPYAPPKKEAGGFALLPEAARGSLQDSTAFQHRFKVVSAYGGPPP